MPSYDRILYGIRVNQSGTQFTSVRSRQTGTRSVTVTTAQHALRRSRPHIYMPPTPFTATMHHFSYGNWRFKDIYGNSSDGVASGTGGSNFLLDRDVGANFPDLEGAAVTQAYGNLKDQDVNYAQAFAERAQTAGLVAQTATKFARGLKRLRKGDVGGFAHELGFSSKKKFKGVQESWLEHQYGWKPLLSDVHGAAKDLFEKDHQEPNRYVISVRGSKSRTFNVPYDVSSDDYHWVARWRAMESVRVRLDYCESNHALATASSLGLTNPLVLAWELLPWSFVADWFIPIGSYLNAADAGLGYDWLGGCSTHRYVYDTNTFSVDRRGPILASLLYWHAGGHQRFRKNVSRRVFSSPPKLTFPGFKNPFSMTHVANALALLGSSVK